MKKLNSKRMSNIKSMFLVTSIELTKTGKIEKFKKKFRYFCKNYIEANKAFICAHCQITNISN